MYRLREIGFFYALALASPLPALAHLPSGPGFDPTPVELPQIQKTALRTLNTVDLLNLRDFHGVQISPDGRYVAFVLGQAVYETNSYRSGLFVVGTESGSKPVSLGSAGPPRWDEPNDADLWLPEAPRWSSDSKAVYYRLRNSGSWQVWKWNRAGGAPVQLTHAKYEVRSFEVSADGMKLLLVVEKPPTHDRKQLAEHGILYDGSIRAGMPRPIMDQILEERGVETETWIHDLGDGNEHQATGEELEAYAGAESDPDGKISRQSFSKREIETGEVLNFKISPDRKKIAYTRRVDDFSKSAWSLSRLFVKSLDGGPPVTLAVWAYYPGQYWWSSNSKKIYYTPDPSEVGNSRPAQLMVVDAAGGKSRRALDSPGFLREYSSDRSGHLLACVYENVTVPPELALADLSTGELRPLLGVNPEFRNLLLSPARRIDISNRFGDHFWGHFVLPTDYIPGKRYPLIITTYRDYDGFLRGGVGDEYPIQVFAANGFSVLNIEAVGRVRNSNPHDFDTTTLLLWESPLEALKAAIAKLTDMGVADPSKVGITGLSFGADLVEYGISHSALFHAAVASGGARDPFTFYLSNDRTRALSFPPSPVDLESPDGDTLVRWQKVSPSFNAHQIHVPLLINAADSEYVNNMQLINTLREQKKPAELFVYPNEDHVKNQPKHRYEIYERNVDWFNFWLKGKEDPSTSKAAQYARWRKLRELYDADTSRTSSYEP
jgi:dipeptidyl aminopeptidase/acylaminoacyl peptidase